MELLKRIDVTEVENFRKNHALRENEGFPAFMDERIREKKIPAMKVGKRFVFSRRKVQAYMTKHLGIAS